MNETACEEDHIINKLLASDQDYFRAGATNVPMLHGVLSLMQHYLHLPAGCVLHSVKMRDIYTLNEKWVADLEKTFHIYPVPTIRFYLDHEHEPLNRTLLSRGFRCAIEVGMATRLDQSRLGESDSALVACAPSAFRAEQLALCAESDLGPDGYNMQAGAYAKLEFAKIDSGYMQPYLYLVKGKLVGSVKLALRGDFARMKNLLVHPRIRNSGVATRIVRALMAHAAQLGAREFGAFALNSGNALRIYEKAGMRPISRQYEWTKPNGGSGS